MRGIIFLLLFVFNILFHPLLTNNFRRIRGENLRIQVEAVLQITDISNTTVIGERLLQILGVTGINVSIYTSPDKGKFAFIYIRRKNQWEGWLYPIEGGEVGLEPVIKVEASVYLDANLPVITYLAQPEGNSSGSPWQRVMPHIEVLAELISEIHVDQFFPLDSIRKFFPLKGGYFLMKSTT